MKNKKLLAVIAVLLVIVTVSGILLGIFLKPDKNDEKDNITLRVSLQTLELIDRKAAQYNLSRNQFLNQCIEYALANMDDTPPEP